MCLLRLALCHEGKTMTDTFQKDYFWEFEGWNKVPSRVHIRIVHEAGKPMMIVCSQPLYGAGTSVQNAYKILKKHLMPTFEMRLGYKESSSSKEEIASLIEEIKKCKKIVTGIAIWALGKLSKKLTRDIYHKYKLRPNLDVVWLEHWPPGTDPIMGPPNDYLLIRENNAGESLHLRVDATEFIQMLRYDPSKIMKSREIFEGDPYAAKA
jgi:hypothetical protein